MLSISHCITTLTFYHGTEGSNAISMGAFFCFVLYIRKREHIKYQEREKKVSVFMPNIVTSCNQDIITIDMYAVTYLSKIRYVNVPIICLVVDRK